MNPELEVMLPAIKGICIAGMIFGVVMACIHGYALYFSIRYKVGPFLYRFDVPPPPPVPEPPEVPTFTYGDD